MSRKNKLMELVANAASQGLDKLPPEQRSDLLEGIALILPNEKESEKARRAAFLIREAESSQLEMMEILSRKEF